MRDRCTWATGLETRQKVDPPGDADAQIEMLYDYFSRVLSHALAESGVRLQMKNVLREF